MTYASVLCVALLLGGGEAFTVPSRTTSRPGVAARPVRTRLASYLDNLKDGPSLDVAEPEAEVAAHAPAYKAPRRMAPAITPESLVESADLLSHQAIMENFVHHNPWEALQHMEFFEALKYVDEASSYMSPGERLAQLSPLDPRVRANKAVAEMGAPFLDRGLAKWEAPHRDKGFLYFFARTEGLGTAPWRSYARAVAREIRKIVDADPDQDMDGLATRVLQANVAALESDPDKWESTLRAMGLDLPGWAGMFKRMQDHPEESPQSCRRDDTCENIPVRLSEFMAVHAILQRSSIEDQATKLGWNPGMPITQFLNRVPNTRRGPRPMLGMGTNFDSLQNPSGMAYVNQNFNAVEKLEAEYAKVTLRAVKTLANIDEGGATADRARTNMQFYTCFDEREESFRRYMEDEAYDENELETFGVAGFFNMAIRYKPDNFRPEEILAPEGQCPPMEHKMYLKELTPGVTERKKLQAEVARLFEASTFSPIGSLAIAGGLLPYSFGRLMLRSFSPELTMELEDSVQSSLMGESKTDFAPPYTADEAVARLGQLFKNVGATDNFARIVVGMGHGARSVNNPFLAAYNCGACCGREGGPNARVWARCANDPEVRRKLKEEHNIIIPDDTWFVGGYHDTTSDLVELYDLDKLPESHKADLARAREVIDAARAKNALERSQKFMLTDASTPDTALRHVELRSRDVAEVRPELGHSTNAAIFVARRSISKGRFWDRRVFMPTYDPFNDDDEGSNLQTVITPALVVGSGISLEYFFSTTDGGAGTKAPVNVVGNFGIQQGTAGDLLIGLATQMSELHSPQRALYLIDAPVARVEKCLARNEVLMNLVRNNWVKFYVRDPYTQEIFAQNNGVYTKVEGLDSEPGSLDYVPFDPHLNYLKGIKAEEDRYTVAATTIMIASAAPVLYNALQSGFGVLPGATSMDFHSLEICLGATALGLSNLAFSRRYLHGEFMYGRMVLDTAMMVTGFNIVAAAPVLDEALLGWTIIGFASTFLIGGFNDRPTARDNAAYAFSVYQLSDAALLHAVAFSAADATVPGFLPEGSAKACATVGLIIAALIKSSQFPLSGLFLRSMEGASPNSALGYAGISAHAGIVLLAGTMSIWGQFDWAHDVIAAIGALTVIQSTLIANVRADRKGGVASASSATLGMLFIVISQGYADAALLLSLGHAAFRMNQVVRAGGYIHDTIKWEEALGKSKIAPERTLDFVWQAGWALNRINSDYFRLPDFYANVDLKQKPVFYNAGATQYIISAGILALAGFIHLPAVDEALAELLREKPAVAGAIFIGNAIASTALIRFLFGNVLDFGRFAIRPEMK